MKVYTYQVSQWRRFKDRDIRLLDTTVKSGIKAFAPTWAMVNGVKQGTLSERAYTVLYRRRMKKSMIAVPEAWDRLMGLESVAIGCYCKPGAFCHRHILLDVMEQQAIEMGIEFVRGGELE